MRNVTSEEIKLWCPLCASLAKKHNGRWGAEYDDLYQEGLIAVWRALREGYRPTALFVERRMKNWVSFCSRKGFTDEVQAELLY